jgi:hypothetical protein
MNTVLYLLTFPCGMRDWSITVSLEDYDEFMWDYYKYFESEGFNDSASILRMIETDYDQPKGTIKWRKKQ